MTIPSFSYPWVLALLVLPFFLGVWVFRRPGRRVVLPFDHGRQRAGARWGSLINLLEAAPALILAVVIIILAGPQQLSEPQEKRILTNIEFCVDISGSMTAPFGEGTRYDASMKAINEFLDYRKGDAFGLTFFGNTTLRFVPLTTDVSAFRCAPKLMDPMNAPPWFGGTEIGKALLACKEVLKEREEGDRMIVLVSDGFSSDLMGGQDAEIAKSLIKEGITVYMIHTAETEIPAEVVTITSMTDGEAFAADDPQALSSVFQRIDTMKKTRMEKLASETMDHFYPYCVAGLSVLALSGLALFGLRYTPW